MQWGARRAIFSKLRIEFVLGLALTIICSTIISQRPVKLAGQPAARNVLVGIGLLFFVMLSHIPFAADGTLARTIFFDRVIKFAMMTFFMVAVIRSPRAMRWFLAAFLFSCFYITQESTRGLISGGLVWQNQGIMRLHGAVPIYAHPNSLGGLAMGTLPFVLFLFPALRWRYRLLLVPLLVTALVCVIYSGSRTAYVALGVLLVYWWSQSRHKIRNALLAVVIGAALIPVIPQQYIGRFESIGGHEAEGESKEARIQILKDAWAVFQKYPMGIGVASFPAVRERMFHREQDTHNLYFEVATNLGVQGLVVFFFLVGFDVRRPAPGADAGSAARSVGWYPCCDGKVSRGREVLSVAARTRRSRFLGAAAQATAGFLIVRLALGVFGMDLYEVYWWFLAGMAFCLLMIAQVSVRQVNILLRESAAG